MKPMPVDEYISRVFYKIVKKTSQCTHLKERTRRGREAVTRYLMATRPESFTAIALREMGFTTKGKRRKKS